MDIPSPAHHHLHISTGSLPCPKLNTLASAHPFTQQELTTQLDVLFPSNPALQAALSVLETSYVKAEVVLSELVKEVEKGGYVSGVEMKSTLTVLSVSPHTDDIWCLDPRGVLTLHLSAESHQKLGITGQKLPFKSRSNEYTVTLPLHPSASSLKNRQKRDDALKAWDARRRQAGEPDWAVLYCGNDSDTTTKFASSLASAQASQIRIVQCQISSSTNVRIPQLTLPARPPSSDLEATEDWEEDVQRAFEWVGMAGFGSQRLEANDRVDAYIAVYDPPSADVTVGDLTRLRWRGFLSPLLVQSVIDVLLRFDLPDSHFVSVTSHAFTAAPVSYIPPGKNKDGMKTPARVPSVDGEDTWSLLLSRERWGLAESIGSLDARWG
ncbi:ribonuclease P protein subunit p40 [Favolaschia claudopus]|uniref:Ribonuclease P protein subunit p40 n=1 Tax=Favolaschia claudopus TaxID=2862362 RepID=A0AAW0BFG6_9AGAR